MGMGSFGSSMWSAMNIFLHVWQTTQEVHDFFGVMVPKFTM